MARGLVGRRNATGDGALGELYGARFGLVRAPGSARSAEAVIPSVVDLLRPASVVDVGCGTGEWLAACRQAGVGEVLGIDGDYVDPSQLRIEAGELLVRDLGRPIGIERRFDLALCLEVAEHLPEARADGFVADLVALAPAVLFSAAIPFQGGTGHLNEQWPEHWAGRFAAHGYLVLDCVRPRVWNDPGVEFWYAQNTLLYVDAATVASDGRLGQAAACTTAEALSRVHPQAYLAKVHDPEVGAATIARQVAKAARAAGRGGARRLRALAQGGRR